MSHSLEKPGDRHRTLPPPQDAHLLLRQMYLIRAFEELVRNLFPAAIGCNQQLRRAIPSIEETSMAWAFLRRF